MHRFSRGDVAVSKCTRVHLELEGRRRQRLVRLDTPVRRRWSQARRRGERNARGRRRARTRFGGDSAVTCAPGNIRYGTALKLWRQDWQSLPHINLRIAKNPSLSLSKFHYSTAMCLRYAMWYTIITNVAKN